MARSPKRPTGAISPLRLAAAVAIVVACGAAVWFLGREQVEEEVRVLVTAEPWPAGSSGLFFEVLVPESLSGLFALPDQLREGMVTSVFLPEGVVVPATVLRHPLPKELTSDQTLLRLEADRSVWPAPGPQVGDEAVFAQQVGGCAVAVLELAAVDEERVTVVVNLETVRRLTQALDLVIWEAPPSGWKDCPAAPQVTPTQVDKTLLRLEADRSVWPAPGPQVGDEAVFAQQVGGCAVAVLELAATDEEGVTVMVDPQLAAPFAEGLDLVIWEAPASGWPRC